MLLTRQLDVSTRGSMSVTPCSDLRLAWRSALHQSMRGFLRGRTGSRWSKVSATPSPGIVDLGSATVARAWPWWSGPHSRSGTRRRARRTRGLVVLDLGAAEGVDRPRRSPRRRNHCPAAPAASPHGRQPARLCNRTTGRRSTQRLRLARRGRWRCQRTGAARLGAAPRKISANTACLSTQRLDDPGGDRPRVRPGVLDGEGLGEPFPELNVAEAEALGGLA